MNIRKLLPRVGLALIALAFAFGLCELGARMIFPRPPDTSREPQVAYLYDPEIRYVLVPGQKGWIDDGLITVNSVGFRGAEIVTPKPLGRFRIVVLGDSLTLGWGVGDEETFSARLEQLLRSRFAGRNVEVVNLGVGGYNTRQEVTLLARHVSRLEPDLVLVGFYSNDVPEALDDAGGGTRILAANPTAGQVMHMNHNPTGWWDRQLRRSRVIYIAGRAFNRWRGAGDWARSQFMMELDVLAGTRTTQIDRAWERVATQFQRLRALADAQRFSVGIVLLPCRELVTGQYPDGKYPKQVRAIAEPLRFHVIDPLPVLVQSRTPAQDLFISYDRNHPSALGHRLVAQAIFRYLDERGLIDVGSGR